jgi:hypothetical protein
VVHDDTVCRWLCLLCCDLKSETEEFISLFSLSQASL